MNYKIEITSVFARQAKRLSKKYPSLKTELTVLSEQLSAAPFLGEALGNNAFKSRLGVESKGKGNRGGMRIITYAVTQKMVVYLVSIYDKSEMGSLKHALLQAYIEKLKST